jgi:hypothetical protein
MSFVGWTEKDFPTSQSMDKMRRPQTDSPPSARQMSLNEDGLFQTGDQYHNHWRTDTFRALIPHMVIHNNFIARVNLPAVQQNDIPTSRCSLAGSVPGLSPIQSDSLFDFDCRGQWDDLAHQFD